MPLSVTHSTAADGTFSSSGITAWDASHTLTGIASAAQGGTGIAFFVAAGPTVARTYTFPDAAATVLTTNAVVTGAQGGTGIANTGFTITLAGNVTTTGAFNTTFAQGASVTLTLPTTSVTLAATTRATDAFGALTDITTNDSTTVQHGFLPKLGGGTTNFLRADGTWAAPTASAALSGISAATGANTIASGTNSGQVWNWALTADSVSAFTFGETTAATGGTSTAGVPNQVIGRFTTLAGSTASPLRVDSRGSHVFSVSPTAVQVLTATGAVSAPFIAPGANTDSGIYFVGTGTRIAVAGVFTFGVTPDQTFITSGTATAPSLTNIAFGTTGLFFPADNTLGISNSTDGEWARFLTRAVQYSRGSADAVGFAENFRKSRGTVAAPTVITTGDDLATISGFGYVGATNTYQQAAGITFTSRGTISDSATGIGGIVSILSAAVGAEQTEIANFRAATTTGGGWMTMDEADADPTTTELDSLDSLSIYNKNNKLVFAYNNAGTITYITVPLDGLTTLWTHGTAAP